jgi:hypothetical protein
VRERWGEGGGSARVAPRHLLIKVGIRHTRVTSISKQNEFKAQGCSPAPTDYGKSSHGYRRDNYTTCKNAAKPKLLKGLEYETDKLIHHIRFTILTLTPSFNLKVYMDKTPIN